METTVTDVLAWLSATTKTAQAALDQARLRRVARSAAFPPADRSSANTTLSMQSLDGITDAEIVTEADSCAVVAILHALHAAQTAIMSLGTPGAVTPYHRMQNLAGHARTIQEEAAKYFAALGEERNRAEQSALDQPQRGVRVNSPEGQLAREECLRRAMTLRESDFATKST